MIPVGLNEYSFLGLGRLAAFLATIRERSGREDLQISVVPNFFDDRVKLPKEFLEDLKDNFTVGKVLGSIRVCQAIPDSQHYKVPVTSFKKKGARKAQEESRRGQCGFSGRNHRRGRSDSPHPLCQNGRGEIPDCIR